MIKKNEEKKEMDCPYLEITPQRECSGATNKREHARPENMGFDEYCVDEEHYRCPIVLARALQGATGWA